MIATEMDVEVEVPDYNELFNERARHSVDAAIRMIEAGAKPEPIIRMLYLLGYFDGLVQV